MDCSLRLQAALLIAVIVLPSGAGSEPVSQPHRPQSAAGTVLNVPVRGVVRAVDRATVSTEAALVAVKLPVREGGSFRRGDLLVEFDCRRQIAEAKAAEAQFHEASINAGSAVALDKQNAVGKNDVEIAKVREARAKAELDALTPRLDECKIEAPFDGRIAELALRIYERTEPQKPFLSIIGDSRLEIEAIVPSRMLSVLRIGGEFEFRVDELNHASVSARVVSIAAAVEPVSKTVKIIGLIEKSIPGVLAGMSGTVDFEAGSN